MNSEQAVAHVIRCLEENRIDYMIVGALSCNLYDYILIWTQKHETIDLLNELRQEAGCEPNP